MGVDIAQDAVRVLHLQRTPNQCRVLHHAREPLPPGAVADGRIEDPSAVGAAIARAASGARCRNAAVALAASVAGVWQVALPAGLAEHELEALAELEALERLPSLSTTDEVWVDFAVLGTLPGAPEQLDVVLAAARSELVQRHVDVLKLGGLVARVVDMETLARERAVAWLARHPPDGWVLEPGVSAQLLAEDAPALASVCGLALREMHQ